ncbi:Crp/Fnr family transcriptional regulator [Nitrospirota bacterium]
MPNISDIGIFSSLSDADMEEIASLVSTESLGKKETIFSEGEPSDWFYAVYEGKVKITKLSVDGKEIILELIKPGELFGAVAVLKGFPYPANAVAMEDSSIMKVSRKNMMLILDRFPALMFNLMESLGDRLRDSHETTKNIALEKVGSRIAALLLKLSEQMGTKTPEGTSLNIKLTKQDIAEMVGTTVETSIRTMSRFKKNGLIKEEGGKVIILDPDGLRDE